MTGSYGDRGRINNDTADDHCPYCQNNGQLPVTYYTQKWVKPDGSVSKPQFEEMAPCPFCVKGYRMEFGKGRRRDGDELVEYTNPRPPWGKDGYWQGRTDRIDDLKHMLDKKIAKYPGIYQRDYKVAPPPPEFFYMMKKRGDKLTTLQEQFADTVDELAYQKYVDLGNAMICEIERGEA